MPGSRFHKVRVSKDDLVFASGHFITYDGGKCEPLHGHNYRMAVEVEDELNGDHYVFDFVALHELARGLAAELDHRMLLPARSHLIRVAEDGPNWDVRYGDRRWSFPRDECVVLPLANTTAELLADYFAGRLLLAFEARQLPRPRILRVEVEESFGQSAQMEWRRES